MPPARPPPAWPLPPLAGPAARSRGRPVSAARRPAGRARCARRSRSSSLGFLVVWLIKPIGNPCPDLERLPQGSTASSSPSFAPPGTRTCTYTAAGGTKATSKYVPWLDWIVLLLLAAGVGRRGAVAALSPARARGRRARTAPPRRRAPEPRARTRAARASARPRASAPLGRARRGRARAGAPRARRAQPLSSRAGPGGYVAQGTSTECSSGASRATTYSAASLLGRVLEQVRLARRDVDHVAGLEAQRVLEVLAPAHVQPPESM